MRVYSKFALLQVLQDGHGEVKVVKNRCSCVNATIVKCC